MQEEGLIEVLLRNKKKTVLKTTKRKEIKFILRFFSVVYRSNLGQHSNGYDSRQEDRSNTSH